MPSLLQMLPPEELDKHRAPSSSPVAPLIIHFSHGWPRNGIFCCLVVYLINHGKWQVILPSTGSPILIARNCVKFRIPRSACTVTLIDSYVNFEIHISAPPPVCRKMAPTIRNLVLMVLMQLPALSGTTTKDHSQHLFVLTPTVTMVRRTATHPPFHRMQPPLQRTRSTGSAPGMQMCLENWVKERKYGSNPGNCNSSHCMKI